MKNSIVLCLLFIWAPLALGQPFKRQLRFEEIHYSQLSPSPGVSGLFAEKERILTMFGGEPAVFAADLKLEDKKFMADMTFEVPSGTRTSFDKSVPAGNWRGVVPFGKETLLFLNGSGATVMALEAKEMKFVSHRQIVIDLVRPSADSRGEPTARETTAARQRFEKNFRLAQDRGLVFTGMTTLPQKWRTKGGAQFILATQIQGFPLVTMACDERDVTQCRLDRICDLAGWRPREPEDIGGIAVDNKMNRLLLADRRDHSLRVFQASSCAHAPHVGDVRLPEKLKSPTGAEVDGAGRLWIATEKPDDYRNGSVFMWEKW